MIFMILSKSIGSSKASVVQFMKKNDSESYVWINSKDSQESLKRL